MEAAGYVLGRTNLCWLRGTTGTWQLGLIYMVCCENILFDDYCDDMVVWFFAFMGRDDLGFVSSELKNTAARI